jgi:hypothetical protein
LTSRANYSLYFVLDQYAARALRSRRHRVDVARMMLIIYTSDDIENERPLLIATTNARSSSFVNYVICIMSSIDRFADVSYMQQLCNCLTTFTDHMLIVIIFGGTPPSSTSSG